MLSNGFGCDFWERLVVQTAHANPAIFRSIVALSTLLEDVSEWQVDWGAGLRAPMNDKTKLALKHYGLALRQLSDHLQGSESMNVLSLTSLETQLNLYGPQEGAPQTEWDTYEQLFSELLAYAAQISGLDSGNNYDKLTAFSLGGGIIFPLASLGFRCRDPKMRRSAISLLARHSKAEGPLLGPICARILARIVAVEEDGLGKVLTSSDVPESSRVTSVSAILRGKGNGAEISYSQLRDPHSGANNFAMAKLSPTRRPFSLGAVAATIAAAASLFPMQALAASKVGGEIVQSTIKIYGDDSYSVPFRRLVPTDAARSRYTGFKPKTTVLKAGTVRREGAKELPCDILFERDVPVTLRDGIVIYTDVFRPVNGSAVPGIVAWSPYGKEVGGQWLDDLEGRSGVPLSEVSELQKFEGPDPAYWVDQGYAVLNPDARGAYASEGNMTSWGRQLAEDGYDFIEWASAQPWSSGKIGMSGNSYLAVSQWFIAAEHPPHLTAIAPWEGLTDVYRDTSNPGGVPAPGFGEAILTTFSGDNFVEDAARTGVNFPLINPYWKDKIARLEKITIPAYIVASYTNVAHTRGTLDAFRKISSKQKWLRVHNTYEWPDYYEPEHVADLTKFFDRYLKGKDNDWEATPRARIAVLDPGGEDTVDRVVSDWPVPGLSTKKLHLHDKGELSDKTSSAKSSLSYNVELQPNGITLNYTVPKLLEINGYMKVKLWVSTIGSSDLDLVVTVEKRFANGSSIVSASGAESSSTIAAKGTLRVSHRALDQSLSTKFEPFHPHDREELLDEGQIVPVEIGLWPIALRFHPGERLALTIAPATISSPQYDMGFGTGIVPVPKNGDTFVPGTKVSIVKLGGAIDSNPEFVNAQRVEAPNSRNNGTHFIHVGGKYDSFLLMPVNITTTRSNA
ncbi:hypothetical protein G7Z17_g1300 [Cylindrodendrum hubeiense]|uniref:Xaa-Pro dipeptidyl-peptidase C-terminal domain-containing protein n=1 Tax=Cylindrodendrum hubeiense TaxID=595255 RepID=A0A9P5LCK9_9HYPO|nr:hypothetical protein G7Z17_g1300 [Cylindrodendrum hubeiense]